jgi:hypothetical protein
MNEKTKCCCGPADTTATAGQENTDQNAMNQSEFECCRGCFERMCAMFCSRGETDSDNNKNEKNSCC